GLSLKYLVPLAAIGRAYINMKMQAAVDLPLMSIYLFRKRAVIAILELPMDGVRRGAKVGSISDGRGGCYRGYAEPAFDSLGGSFVECVVEFAQRMMDNHAKAFFVRVLDALVKMSAVKAKGRSQVPLHA